MIWVVMAALALIASCFVIMPVLRPALSLMPASDRTLAVLRDQLSEVENDTARGLISQTEAYAASQEIKRRVLSFQRRKSVDTFRGDGRLTIMIAALLVPLLAAAYYSFAGAPNISGIAFSDRRAEIEQNREIEALVQKLLQRLEADSEGGPLEGWMLLGQTYMKLGRATEAASAYKHATENRRADSAVFSMYAEALTVSEKGIVTPQADKAIDRALKLDPANPAATFYKAIALSQSGAEEQAYDVLLKRLKVADGFGPWMETFVSEANRIGATLGRAPVNLADYTPMLSDNAPGPTAADVEATGKMDAAERGTFIRSMVERLATRLESEPDDIDGWMRLGKAYTVLGDVEKALNAYGTAEEMVQRLNPDDPRRDAILRSMSELAAAR